jgi:Restriction Enzyme Adenine Methylase Associated
MADDLLTLIRTGKLPSGTALRHRFVRVPKDAVTSTVVDDGIRVKGKIYTTPSAAARAITGAPVDGWLFWKLPTGEPLGALRTEVRRIARASHSTES